MTMTQYILKGNILGYNTTIFLGCFLPLFLKINDSGVREMLNGEKITLSPISCTLYIFYYYTISYANELSLIQSAMDTYRMCVKDYA